MSDYDALVREIRTLVREEVNAIVGPTGIKPGVYSSVTVNADGRIRFGQLVNNAFGSYIRTTNPGGDSSAAASTTINMTFGSPGTGDDPDGMYTNSTTLTIQKPGMFVALANIKYTIADGRAWWEPSSSTRWDGTQYSDLVPSSGSPSSIHMTVFGIGWAAVNDTLRLKFQNYSLSTNSVRVYSATVFQIGV